MCKCVRVCVRVSECVWTGDERPSRMYRLALRPQPFLPDPRVRVNGILTTSRSVFYLLPLIERIVNTF